MRMSKFLALLLILCYSHALCYKLHFVQVVTRHGDRTPLTKLPRFDDNTEWNCAQSLLSILDENFVSTQNDSPTPPRLYRQIYLKDREVFKGNCSTGQLTEKGARQHYDIGKNFRRLYVDTLRFLNSTFDPTAVQIRSTDIPRTIQSAQSQLLGLYPTVKKPSTEIITITSVETSQEDMYANSNLCPQLAVLQSELKSSAQWKEFEQQVAPFKQQLAAIFDVPVSKLLGWSALLDAFTCRQSHGIPLPKGITQDMVNKIYDIAYIEYRTLLQYRNYATLAMGSFVRELYDKMLSAIEGSKLKFKLYSGHDTTIAPLSAAFGIYQGYWPVYAANIVFELAKLDTETTPPMFGVRFILDGEIQTLPKCADAVVGDGWCPWSRFTDIVNQIVSTADKQCFP